MQAMTLTESDQAHRLIPEINVPLYPRVCMCQSMQDVANAVRFPIPIPLLSVDLSCSSLPDCSGVHCTIGVGTIGNYIADITVNPCEESVHMVVSDSSNQPQFDRVYRDSGNYSFPIGSFQTTLLIGIVHHNYSMDLSVSLTTAPKI